MKKLKSILLILWFLLIIIFILWIVKFYNKKNNQANINFISLSIPIGVYSTADVSSTVCGIATKSWIVGSIDDSKSFSDPHHYLAQLIWFGSNGYLEYKLKNPLPKNNKINILNLSFEACSEAPSYDLNQKTDISIYINWKKITTYTIKGDFGWKKWKYTPNWWPIDNSQYWKLIFIQVRKDGTYINTSDNKKLFKKISKINIDDLNLNKNFINIKIWVDENAKNKGWLNLFWEKFWNYPINLKLQIWYKWEKIYQPKIIDIINNSKKYNNKTVILTVHPWWWSCPSKNTTLLPIGFNRSATMVYDNSGCIYWNWNILVGKILVPDLHTINTPWKETIIIKGKIKLDKNNTPFLVPTW